MKLAIHKEFCYTSAWKRLKGHQDSHQVNFQHDPLCISTSLVVLSLQSTQTHKQKY